MTAFRGKWDALSSGPAGRRTLRLMLAALALLPLAACGGSPMTVESRYVDPNQAPANPYQPLAPKRDADREGHN